MQSPGESSYRSGVTVVEILTAAGIISLILALIVPAIQKAREEARRAHCLSNLHHVMLAQHQYHELHGCFPGVEGDVFVNVTVFIDYSEADPAKKIWPTMCPTDALNTDELQRSLLTSYHGNRGIHLEEASGIGDGFTGGYRWSEDGPDTIFITQADILDGLSNTSAASERLALPAFHSRDVDWNDYPHLWGRLILLTDEHHEDLQEMADECDYRAGKPRVTQLMTSYYNHVLPPNHNSCTNGRPFNPNMIYPLTASSLHQGGANVAMADCSVRFVSEQINRQVWWAMGTRNGGEP
ncbi:MAG: DUF1559 domain-containing protein [Planctomycetaceae bacterium]|nr:DUF1559 domain-containing protein [Planctomycetaceae bacterium]